ncbi:rod-binding protein [Desulfolithobacter sp.]
MNLQIDPRTVLSPTVKSSGKEEKNDPETLKKLCQDFEAVFIQYLLKSMRKTVPEGGLFAKDNAHEIYQEMLDAELAADMARTQSTGMADTMYRQMQRLLGDNSEKP